MLNMAMEIFEMRAVTAIVSDGSCFPDGHCWLTGNYILQACPVVEGLGQDYMAVHLVHHFDYLYATLQ